MPIDLDDKLVETATRITVTRNEYGDTIYGSGEDVPCLYRDISSLSRVANREDVLIDGLLWLRGSEPAERGGIYFHQGINEYLRVQRIIRAKTLLTDDDTKFIKCEVTLQRQLS